MKPPRLSEALLRRILPPSDRDAFPPELEELFRERAARHGPFRARWWYRRQVAELLAGTIRVGGGPGRRTRDTRDGSELLDALGRDLRLAFRALRRRPGFTAVAVVSLSLGIGANTAIFSLVETLLLRDVPFAEPQELVEVYTSAPGAMESPLSYPDVRDVRETLSDGVFAGVATARLALAPVEVEGGVDMLAAEVVSGDLFPMLGVDAVVGRTLTRDDDVSPGGHPVVMLGHGYWQRRYAGDPGAVGREIRVAGRSYTVVGVAPADHRGVLRGLEADLFFPASMVNEVSGGGFDELASRGNQSWFTRARLAPGVDIARAQAALERLAIGLRRDHPANWTGERAFSLIPTVDVVVHPAFDRILVPALGILLAVAGIVLLIACANLASFLLARAVDRRREVAVRLALGARRGTLIRQLLVETVLLALIGGALGLGVATLVLRLVLGLELPVPVPINLDVGLNRSVLMYAAVISVATGIFFGLVPALRATRPDVAPTLRDEGTGTAARGTLSLRNALVAGQVALSMTLLVGAGLLLRSFLARQDVDPGFGHRPGAVVTLRVPVEGYASDRSARSWLEGLESRLEAARPGLEVGRISNLHLNTLGSSQANVDLEGVTPPAGSDAHVVDRALVDEDFFRAAGIELLHGRSFSAVDVPEGERAVVVNEAFARRFSPGLEPRDAARSFVGRTVVVDEVRSTVVGVVRTVRVRTLGEAPTPFVYLYDAQNPGRYATVVATVPVDPGGVAETIVREVVGTAREMEPRILVYEARTLERHLGYMLLPHRLSAAAAGVFALLALILAAVGLYGVVSYAVARRAREVGIRMSLGADAGQVIRMLVRSGLRLVLAGAAAGLVLAFLFARILGGFLYAVPSLDPVTFVGVPLLLLAVSALAAWVPARRVARMDAARILRGE